MDTSEPAEVSANPTNPPPREYFPKQRIRTIVRDFDARMNRHKDHMGLVDATYRTRFWTYFAGYTTRTATGASGAQAWMLNGFEVEVNRLRKTLRTYLGDLYPKGARVHLEADPHGRGDPEISRAVLNEWWKKRGNFMTTNDAAAMALAFPGSGFKVGFDKGDQSPLQRVWLRAVPPWELVLDLDVTSVEDERYRGHVYQAEVLDVIERYPKLRKMGLKGSPRRDFFDGFGTTVGSETPTGPMDPEYQREGATGDFVRVLEFNNLRDFYEYPDGSRVKGRLEVWVLDQNEAISGCPIYCGPLPFEDADGTPLPNVVPLTLDREIAYPFRAIGAMDQMMPQQVELNMMRTFGAQDVRRNARKFQYEDGAISDEELAKLNNGVDMQGVKRAPNVDPARALSMIPNQPIAADTLQYTAVVERDLAGQTGPSANAQGKAVNTTAFEAELIQKHVEAELAYHGQLLIDALVAVTQLVQAAILLAAMTPLDSAGGGGPSVDVVAVDGGEPVGEVEATVTEERHAFRPFVIRSGGQTFEVTEDALIGNFGITFVDAETTPVNRQARLQFLTGPGMDQYMKWWDLVQKGGPMAMLAKASMRVVADTMNLPRDMHPDTMLQSLKEEAETDAAKPKPPRAVAGKKAVADPPPTAEPAPAPESAAPPANPGVDVVVDTLTGLSDALAQVAGAETSTAALTEAAKAAQSGDLAGLGGAVQQAIDALPPETPAEIVDALGQLAEQIAAAGQEEPDAPV